MISINGFINTVKTGVRNLFTWFPVIWNDRDWDYYFIFKLLEFKLNKMAKYQRKNGTAINHKSIARRMEITAMALRRLMDDEYDERAMMDHTRKYGEYEMWTTPTDDPELVECNITRTKVCDTETYNKEKREFLDRMDHARYIRNQDLCFVFDNMKKYIDTWWD